MNNRIEKLALFHMMNENVMQAIVDDVLKDIDKIVDELYHALPLEQAAVLLTLDENIKQHFYGVDSED
jgi:ATP-dependent Clp protease ATP-binding subunit ClpA